MIIIIRIIIKRRHTCQDGTGIQEIYWGKWLWRIKGKGVGIEREGIQKNAGLTHMKGEREKGLSIKVSVQNSVMDVTHMEIQAYSL